MAERMIGPMATVFAVIMLLTLFTVLVLERTPARSIMGKAYLPPGETLPAGFAPPIDPIDGTAYLKVGSWMSGGEPQVEINITGDRYVYWYGYFLNTTNGWSSYSFPPDLNISGTLWILQEGRKVISGANRPSLPDEGYILIFACKRYDAGTPYICGPNRTGQPATEAYWTLHYYNASAPSTGGVQNIRLNDLLAVDSATATADKIRATICKDTSAAIPAGAFQIRFNHSTTPVFGEGRLEDIPTCPAVTDVNVSTKDVVNDAAYTGGTYVIRAHALSLPSGSNGITLDDNLTKSVSFAVSCELCTTPGATMCTTDGKQRTCTGSCWGQPVDCTTTSCGPNCVCTGTQCMPVACTDTAGNFCRSALACPTNGASGTGACSGQQICCKCNAGYTYNTQTGTCDQTSGCTNDCSVGQTRCSGTQVQNCGEANDGDTCRDWLAPTNCGFGQTCSGGACVPTQCQDQCSPEGAAQCSTSGTPASRTCARNHDADTCLEWGPYNVCSGISPWCNPATGLCSTQQPGVCGTCNGTYVSTTTTWPQTCTLCAPGTANITKSTASWPQPGASVTWNCTGTPASWCSAGVNTSSACGLGAPSNLAVIQITTTTARVTWTPGSPAGPSQELIVCLPGAISGSTCITQNLAASTASFDLTGLTQGTVYSVNITNYATSPACRVGSRTTFTTACPVGAVAHNGQCISPRYTGASNGMVWNSNRVVADSQFANQTSPICLTTAGQSCTSLGPWAPGCAIIGQTGKTPLWDAVDHWMCSDDNPQALPAWYQCNNANDKKILENRCCHNYDGNWQFDTDLSACMTCTLTTGQFCSAYDPGNTDPGTGGCATGSCYKCDVGYEWNGQLCTPTTCVTQYDRRCALSGQVVQFCNVDASGTKFWSNELTCATGFANCFQDEATEAYCTNNAIGASAGQCNPSPAAGVNNCCPQGQSAKTNFLRSGESAVFQDGYGARCCASNQCVLGTVCVNDLADLGIADFNYKCDVTRGGSALNVFVACKGAADVGRTIVNAQGQVAFTCCGATPAWAAGAAC